MDPVYSQLRTSMTQQSKEAVTYSLTIGWTEYNGGVM